jgi:hypothetical protein
MPEHTDRTILRISHHVRFRPPLPGCGERIEVRGLCRVLLPPMSFSPMAFIN